MPDLFKCPEDMPKGSEPMGGPTAVMVVGEQPRAQRLSVGVDMTPEEQRYTMRSCWPQYDLLSVDNLSPRNRGKHY